MIKITTPISVCYGNTVLICCIHIMATLILAELLEISVTKWWYYFCLHCECSISIYILCVYISKMLVDILNQYHCPLGIITGDISVRDVCISLIFVVRNGRFGKVNHTTYFYSWIVQLEYSGNWLRPYNSSKRASSSTWKLLQLESSFGSATASWGEGNV